MSKVYAWGKVVAIYEEASLSSNFDFTTSSICSRNCFQMPLMYDNDDNKNNNGSNYNPENLWIKFYSSNITL